jgi:Leucine-rich repeat (LRR) protein
MLINFLLISIFYVGGSWGTFELECDYKHGVFGYACIVNDSHRKIPVDVHLNSYHAPNHTDEDVHHFSFGFNVVSRVPGKIFTKFPNLSKLVMIGRHLEEIYQEDFVNATELTFFHAGANFLKMLGANTFVESPKLETLIFDFNHIKFISENAFANLSHLTHLYLTHNEINHLNRDTMLPLKNLEMIFLNENQLEFIPQGLFRKNKKLTTINLAENKIMAVTYKAFYKLRLLNDLDFRNNTCVDLHFRNASQKIGAIESALTSCDSPSYSEDLKNDFIEIELEVVEEKILNLTRNFENLSVNLQSGFKELSNFVKTWLENSTKIIEDNKQVDFEAIQDGESLLNLVEEKDETDKVLLNCY